MNTYDIKNVLTDLQYVYCVGKGDTGLQDWCHQVTKGAVGVCWLPSMSTINSSWEIWRVAAKDASHRQRSVCDSGDSDKKWDWLTRSPPCLFVNAVSPTLNPVRLISFLPAVNKTRPTGLPIQSWRQGVNKIHHEKVISICLRPQGASKTIYLAVGSSEISMVWISASLCVGFCLHVD